MGQYTYKDLWDREELDRKDHTNKQVEKAEKDILEGMTIVDGLNSEFWKLLKRDFIEPKLSNDRIDTASPEELLAIQRERRIFRELFQYLEERAKAGKRASSYLKTLKQKEA